MFHLTFKSRRFVLGAVLAVVAAAALIAVHTPDWVVPLVMLGFLAFGSFRWEPEEPFRTMAIVLIPILGAFLLMWLTQGAMGSQVLPLTFQEFILGVAIGYGMILFFTIINANAAVGAALGMALLLLLVTADYYVYTFRGTELLPTDMLAARTALSVAGEYNYTPSANLVQVWVFYALFIFGASSVRLGHLGRKRLTMAGVPILAALSIAIGLGMTGLTSQQWHLHGVNYNGFMLNFAIELRDSFIRKPAGYDTAVLEKKADAYGAALPAAEEDDPTIIVIMDESYADFRRLGEHFQTNIDVMPFYDSLQEDTIRGFALSSVYGGGTANSEYEFLTGNSLAYLPAGCVAYQQYLPEDAYSMVSSLRDRGYATVAMHPYYASGWMRNKVWPQLGFDETYFLESFPQRNLVRRFVSDQEMFEKVVRRYETRDKSRPLFLFGVTMQNHGGYRYYGENYMTEVRLRGFTQAYPRAEQYLTLIHETDKALQYLIEYFQQVDEKVVIAFFGDHLPSLDQEFYEEIHGGPFEDLTEQMLQYTIPFFVWANYDIPEQDVELTSINFMSNYVYDAAGIEKPAYTKLLEEISAEIPAINSKGFWYSAGNKMLPIDEAEDDEAATLNLFSQLQYNNTFDKKHRLDIFRRYTEIEPSAQSIP